MPKLPKGLCRKGKAFYYRKWVGGRDVFVPLGSDYEVARLRFGELKKSSRPLVSVTVRELAESVSSDPDPAVREQAAVALGVAEVPGAAAALVPALKDASWAVATCAANPVGE